MSDNVAPNLPINGGSQDPVVSSTSDDAMNFAIARRFVFNQQVNVNIEGSGWLVGTVVAIMTAVKSMTGSRVRVKYSAPHDSRVRTTVVPDDPRFIRPLGDQSWSVGR